MNKISYALGLGIGQQLKSMGIEDFSVEDFTKSICDVLTDSKPAISHREAQALLNEYFDKQARRQAEGAIAQGKVAAASVNLLAKNPDHWAKGMILCITVEFYAILSLLASMMMLLFI